MSADVVLHDIIRQNPREGPAVFHAFLAWIN